MLKYIRDILRDLHNHPLSLVSSILAGLCAGLLIYIYHFQLPLYSKSQMILCLVIALVIAALVYVFLQRVTWPDFSSYSIAMRTIMSIVVISLSILLSFTLVYTIPHIYPLYPSHQLTVNLDLQNMPIDGEGISFSHLQLAFRDVSFSELSIEGQYTVKEDSIYFPAGQSVQIAWQGITGESASLYFHSTSQPSTVKIIWDGQSQFVDLSQTSDTIYKVSQDFATLPSEKLIIRLVAFPLIVLVLFILATGIFSPKPYAYILLTVWLLIYVIFWPGIIGSVSILAVDDLWQGHPTDWHPIIFTLLVSFCIQVFSSASSVLIIQIICLALLFGYVFSFLQKKGVSKIVLVFLSLIIALLPTNFLSMITLTNDIPYSIALMALTFLAFKIVITNGKWLEKTQNLILLSTVSSLAILFRYNGIPAVGFFFICLLLFFPKLWRKSLISLSAVLAIWLLVSGPLSGLLNVTKESQGHLDNILLHHISAHVANGTHMTAAESAYLDELLPLEDWKYSCCSNAAMWANDDFDRVEFHANSIFNRQLELSLFKRNPSLEVSHMLCASDIVWNVSNGCEIKHPFVEQIKGRYYWTRSYLPQYLENSFLPGLIEPISRWLIGLDEIPVASALLWHPAWYLYAAIICVIIFSRKIKSARGLLVLAPALGQSLFLLIFNRVQNFRYQYCMVLVGFLLIAIAFYQPKSDEKEHAG